MRNMMILLLACLVLTMTGCNQETTSPASPDNAAASSQTVPSHLQKLLDQYALPEDGSWPQQGQTLPIVTAPSVTDTSYDVYAVTFLWGSFLNAAASPVPVDWSGKLSVNAEAVFHVKCLIDFEPGEDYLLPVVSPGSVAWVSQTKAVDFDGLSCLVFLKRGSVLTVIPELFFETKPISLQWNFETLAKLDAYYPVDNLSGVAVHARRLKPLGCPRGLLEGKWIKEGSLSGHFEGMWLDHNGVPIGVYAGRYWDDTLKQFEGWVSGLFTDQIIAEMEGFWYYDDPRMCPMCGEGHGRFKGKVRWVGDNAVGAVEGEFGNYAFPPDDKVMPMKGQWHRHCTNQPGDDTRADN